MRTGMSLLAAFLIFLPGLSAAQEAAGSSPSFSLSDYQHVEGTDLYMNPGAYLRKPIELEEMTCSPAGDKGFTCKSRGDRLIVFAPDLTPASEKKLVLERCNPTDDLHRQRCKRTIRLVPERIEGEKGQQYSAQRLLIKTSVIDAAPYGSDSRQNQD